LNGGEDRCEDVSKLAFLGGLWLKLRSHAMFPGQFSRAALLLVLVLVPLLLLLRLTTTKFLGWFVGERLAAIRSLALGKSIAAWGLLLLMLNRSTSTVADNQLIKSRMICELRA
jgi:hypothetical protein